MKKSYTSDTGLMVSWELLIRQLLAVRKKLGIPWDDDMEEIMRIRDRLNVTEEEDEKDWRKEALELIIRL